MIKRRNTVLVRVGSVGIGSAAPIVVQSMTKVPTTDIERCAAQIEALAAAGCKLVRVAVPTRADTAAFARIVPRVSVPLIADIHFSPQRAIEAIEAGAAKIRLNPGNVRKKSDVFRIIDAARMHKVAIRVGVNEASIRDLKSGDVAAARRVNLMLREMTRYVRLFEGRRFRQIVLSAKSSDTVRTIEINRAIAARFEYPIHLGLTHAGLAADAQIPSAVALGALLAEGIGDTIRVSAAADPLVETHMAVNILMSLGLLPRQSLELIVCPTCARAEIDIVALAGKVKAALAAIQKPLRVAVMGCIVNGPGEAADADVAVCAAKNKGFIYRRGRRIGIVAANRIVDALLEEVEKL